MRILIVEDEKKMASFLERGLKEEHYTVDIAYDGEKGWEYAMTNDSDLLILDWMLPKMSGVELCHKFRKEGKITPVLILTAKDSVDDKIKGLDQGAEQAGAQRKIYDAKGVAAPLQGAHCPQGRCALVGDGWAAALGAVQDNAEVPKLARGGDGLARIQSRAGPAGGVLLAAKCDHLGLRDVHAEVVGGAKGVEGIQQGLEPPLVVATEG